jgi:predicted porin
MKKKLLVAAVAGALAAPGLALAQSSVTISGVIKASMEQIRIGTPSAARTNMNTTENRLADDSSRVIFNVVEDLGGGLQAIGQFDIRFPVGSGAAIAASGNTHVGLRSKTMGRIFVGRQDVHYFNTESNLTSLAGDLRADSISLLAYMRDGTTAIAGATRTPNIVHYTTPNWSGFTAILAYSFNAGAAAQADLTTANIRKGYAWNINPNYEAQNWQIGYSYWMSKPDGGGATLGTSDQRADRVYGSFKMAGFKVGLAWDRSRLKSSAASAGLAGVTGNGGVVGGAFGSGTEIADRQVWSLPIGYTMGNHQFHGSFSRAQDDKKTSGALGSDGAKMVALSYQYTLSKRTSVGLTYAKITNDVGAAYNFFTGSSLGNSAIASNAGEDPRLYAATVRHAF